MKLASYVALQPKQGLADCLATQEWLTFLAFDWHLVRVPTTLGHVLASFNRDQELCLSLQFWGTGTILPHLAVESLD